MFDFKSQKPKNKRDYTAKEEKEKKVTSLEKQLKVKVVILEL